MVTAMVLANGPSQSEEYSGYYAGARIGNDDVLDDLEPGGAQGVGRLLQVRRHERDNFLPIEAEKRMIMIARDQRRREYAHACGVTPIFISIILTMGMRRKSPHNPYMTEGIR